MTHAYAASRSAALAAADRSVGAQIPNQEMMYGSKQQ